MRHLHRYYAVLIVQRARDACTECIKLCYSFWRRPLQYWILSKQVVRFQNLESSLLHNFLVAKDLVIHVRPVKLRHGGTPAVLHSASQSDSTEEVLIQCDKSFSKELELDCKDNGQYCSVY